MQERVTVYTTAIRDLADLKRGLIAEWSDLQQSIVDDVVDQWRKRLRCCVERSGRNLEHLLYIGLGLTCNNATGTFLISAG